MNDNIFIDKFEKKTDSELEYILVNRDNYTDEAISGAIFVLKKRHVTSELLESIEKELQTKTENTTVEPEKFETSENKMTEDASIPELYSKKVIFAFTIIFSTIFGAVLLMYNMQQIKSKTGRNQVLFFGITYLLINALTVNSFAQGQNLSLILNILGGLILTEYFWNTYIGKETEHIRKSWTKPAIISLLIVVPLVIYILYQQPNLLK